MESDKVAISVTVPTDLLKDIDERSAELDVNRSQYFRKLAREDLERHGKLTEKNQMALGLGNEEAA